MARLLRLFQFKMNGRFFGGYGDLGNMLFSFKELISNVHIDLRTDALLT